MPHCRHSQTYGQDELLLHTGLGIVYTPEPSKSPASVAAVIAGMVTAVRLARVDSAELQRSSPRVRAAVSDGITIAHEILAEMGRQCGGR